MPLVGFEPIISASERPLTYALDHAATGTGHAKQFKISYFRTNTDVSQKIKKSLSYCITLHSVFQYACCRQVTAIELSSIGICIATLHWDPRFILSCLDIVISKNRQVWNLTNLYCLQNFNKRFMNNSKLHVIYTHLYWRLLKTMGCIVCR